MTKTQEYIVRALLLHEGQWLSRNQVGREIGLKKTPYLHKLLDDLADRGVVERTLGSYGGFSCWFFRASCENVQKFVVSDVHEFFMLGEQNAK